MSKPGLWCALLFVAVSPLALVGCDLHVPAEAQPFTAKFYFEGKALELAQAIDRRDAASINRLVHQEGVNPDVTFDAQHMPMVGWPLINKNYEGLRLLLEAGANPNARYRPVIRDDLPGAPNAMIYAAGMKDSRYLALLLDHGGDPNTISQGGEPLTYTARLADAWPNVQLLIERGADVNHRISGNETRKPIDWYSMLGDFEQVYWLLQHGADPMGKLSAPDLPEGRSMPTVTSIFYMPVQDWAKPWQEKCQVWLLERGMARPPIPKNLRSRREAFGMTNNVEDIPLPVFTLLPEDQRQIPMPMPSP